MHESIELNNFTAFEHIALEFVPGINVLVGGNGTGKTHLMKALYVVQKGEVARADLRLTWEDKWPHYELMLDVFRPDWYWSLFYRGDRMRRLNIGCVWNAQPLRLGMMRPQIGDPDIPGWVLSSERWKDVTAPVFIPVKDMLAHTRGFVALHENREIDFESTYSDLVKAVSLPPLRGGGLKEALKTLQVVEDAIGGKVMERGGRYYLVSNGSELEMPLVAEGWRKLATLWLLIQNGSLGKGKVLFWDEPEANLNPALMGAAAKLLVGLAEAGVQVFLATHSYLILRELEIQRSPRTSMRFICLDRDSDGKITSSYADDYLSIQPNLIEDEYLSVYDRLVMKRPGGTK